jgi:hypothetical protein
VPGITLDETESEIRGSVTNEQGEAGYIKIGYPQIV